MPLPYGMPIEEPLPLRAVTKPTTISARAEDAASNAPVTTHAQRRMLLMLVRSSFREPRKRSCLSHKRIFKAASTQIGSQLEADPSQRQAVPD